MNDILHTLQRESEQRPHKLSYAVSVKGDAVEKMVSQLEDKLQAADMISSNSCTKGFCSSKWLREYMLVNMFQALMFCDLHFCTFLDNSSISLCHSSGNLHARRHGQGSV